MRRTWKQQAFFLSGWVVAAAACLVSWAGGYNLGWLHCYEGEKGMARVPSPVGKLFNVEPIDDEGGLANWLNREQLRSPDGDTLISGPLPVRATGG